MKFKIYFDQTKNKFNINYYIYNDPCIDELIPEKLNDCAIFNFPAKEVQFIKDAFNNIIPEEESEKIRKIEEEIKNLQKHRQEMVLEVRRKFNPILIEKCRTFKEDYPEYYI